MYRRSSNFKKNEIQYPEVKEVKNKVALFLRCEDLKTTEILGSFKVQIKVFTYQDDKLVPYGETEKIWNNLAPKFIRNFEFEYFTQLL